MVLLLYLAILFAIIEWYGEYNRSNMLIYFSKPMVMVFVIAWFLLQADFSAFSLDNFNLPVFLFTLGMVSCLLGDIFLMLPTQYFLPGLFSFLVGHIFYIFGFGRIIPPKVALLPGVILFLLTAAVSLRVYLIVSKRLVMSGNVSMRVPIAVYSIVISIMLYAGTISLLDSTWNYLAALTVSIGVLLFYISDILNAWNRFVRRLKPGRILIMSTYHLAQIAIAVGVAQQYIYNLT